TSCMCSTTRANTSPCAARSTSRAQSKAGRSLSRPGPPRPAANSRRKRRRPCSRPKPTSPPGGRSTPPSNAAPRRPDVHLNPLKIRPACFGGVGDTVEEARAKRSRLDSLVHYDNAIASLSIALGHDASRFDPDGPLPEIPESNASKSGRQRAIELARREKLT